MALPLVRSNKQTHLIKHCVIYIDFTGDDYSTGPYNVTFPAGKTAATFDLQLHDDNIFEKNETFQLIIDQHSFSSVERLSVNPFVITFIVYDDDGKY